MQESTDLSPILELDFNARRCIRVISDREFDSREEVIAAPVPTAKPDSSIWLDVALIAPAVVPGGPLVRGLILAGGIAYTAYTTRTNQSKGNAVGKVGTDLILEVPVRHTRGLTFSTKYAEAGSFYAGNPLDPNLYYPVETYVDDLIVHKLCELELLLSALGAKRFDIKYQEDTSDFAGANLKAGKLPVDVQASISTSRRKRFERSGTSDGCDPALPDELKWFDHEPDWKTLALSRMKYGRREFSFSVELKRGLEISAKSVLGLKELGCDIGVEYDRQRNLTLAVSGTF